MTEPVKQTPEAMLRECMDAMARVCGDIIREIQSERPTWGAIMDHFTFLWHLKGRGEIIHDEILRDKGKFPKERGGARHVDHPF